MKSQNIDVSHGECAPNAESGLSPETKLRLARRLGIPLPLQPKSDGLARLEQKLKEGAAKGTADATCAAAGGGNGVPNSEQISNSPAANYGGPIKAPETSSAGSAVEAVARPGISQATLAAAGVRYVTEDESKRLIGHCVEGLLIPYFDIDGLPLIGKHGAPYYRVRLANPTGSAKYLSPRGTGCELYVPPGLRELLTEGCLLGVVEGEFKALSLTEAGFPCVGIGGISSVAPRNEDSHPELLPALQEIILAKQPARLAFIGDSDTALIPDFSRECLKLAKCSGVPVVAPRIPINAPGKGPDDLRQHWGEEFQFRWQSILDAAEPITPGTAVAQLIVRLLRREAGALPGLDQDAADKARQRLVKLSAALHSDALARAEVEKIAAEFAGLDKQTLRAAVRDLQSRQVVESAAKKLAQSGTTIVLPGNETSITEAAVQIFTIIAPTQTLFYRGGRVHEVESAHDGTRRLRPVTPVQFRSRLESYGTLLAWRSGGDDDRVLKPVICAEETAHALLESTPARDLLPNIATLSACPVLARQDGKIVVLGVGWHQLAGGLFVTGGETPPEIGLSEAVLALAEIVSEFDFPTAGDRSRAMASLIAPALRFGAWLKNPLPIDVAEADASQAGKTYRQKVVAAIYRERPNMVVQHSAGVGSLDESIAQKLIDGRPFVLLDNFRGKLNSPYLESVLTAPGPMPARVPHRGEVQVDPRGFVFQITSNGAETTRDLANRASIVRIRKRPEDFPFRKYPEGDLYAHVQANQARYLGCVFSVVEAWAQNGCQRTDENRHDFREWVQILDWIVQNIFASAPLMDGHDEARQRASDPRRVWLRSVCIALRDSPPAGPLIASELAEFAIENELLPPNIRADADEESMARSIGKIMASVFRETDDVQIDGFRIRRGAKYSSKAGKSIPTYSFG